MKLLLHLFSFLCLLLCSVSAIGQNASIAFQDAHGRLKLADRGSYAQLMLDSADWPGVLRAADDLAVDFGRVTGVNGSVMVSNAGNKQTLNASMIFNVTRKPNWNVPGAKGSKGGVIIAGTLGRSTIIDSLVQAKKINVGQIEGQWEAFVSQIVQNPMPGVKQALVIAGMGILISQVSLPESLSLKVSDSRSWQQEAIDVAPYMASTISPSRLAFHPGTTGQTFLLNARMPSTP